MGVSAERALPAERRWRVTIPLRDVVALGDMWILLAMVWGSRLAMGYIDPSIALVALAAFLFLSSPAADRRLNPGPLDDGLQRTVAWFRAAG